MDLLKSTRTLDFKVRLYEFVKSTFCFEYTEEYGSYLRASHLIPPVFWWLHKIPNKLHLNQGKSRLFFGLCNILIAIYYDVSRFCSVESGIRYNCAAVHYDMHVGSLSLEFALVSSLLLPLLHLVVPVMFLLWHCRYSFILSRKCLAVLDSNPKNSASI